MINWKNDVVYAKGGGGRVGERSANRGLNSADIAMRSSVDRCGSVWTIAD